MSSEALRAEYPPDRLKAGVTNAIANHDVKAAVEILEIMVRLHPVEGLKLYDEVQEALVVAKFLNGGRW